VLLNAVVEISGIQKSQIFNRLESNPSRHLRANAHTKSELQHHWQLLSGSAMYGPTSLQHQTVWIVYPKYKTMYFCLLTMNLYFLVKITVDVLSINAILINSEQFCSTTGTQPNPE